MDIFSFWTNDLLGAESFDFFLQPTLLPSVTGFIENIKITFTESIETFENDLCNILLNNQLNNEDIEINERHQILVTERRLEVKWFFDSFDLPQKKTIFRLAFIMEIVSFTILKMFI